MNRIVLVAMSAAVLGLPAGAEEAAEPVRMDVRAYRGKMAEAVEAQARLQKWVDDRYYSARLLFRADRFDEAKVVLEEILRVAPTTPRAERLLMDVEQAIAEHRGRRLEREEFVSDLEAIEEVNRESRFPEEKGRLPRPELPRREDMVGKSDAMKRMEALLEQRIMMNFIDADLDYVLNVLFKTTGVNIIADQSVLADKRLTLHVDNLPLREVLKFIARNNEDISYSVTEDAVWIHTPDNPVLVTRIYPLNIGLIGETKFQPGRGASRYSGGGMGGRGGGRGGAGTSQYGQGGVSRTGGWGAGLGSPTTMHQVGPQSQSSAQASGGTTRDKGNTYIEQVFDWMTSLQDEWPTGSDWYLDLQTNSVLVHTTVEVHEKMEKLLAIMDVEPVQVLIRTKFVEIKQRDLKDLGVDWKFFHTENIPTGWDSATFRPIFTPTEFSYGTAFGVSGGSGFSMEEMDIDFRDGERFSVTDPSTGNLATVQLPPTMKGWASTLNLLLQTERARLLSAPQIIALNNQLASIDVSTSFSYASSYTPANNIFVGDTTSVTAPASFMPSQFQQVDVGFRLEVIPSVGRDLKTITLDIHPIIDDIMGGEDRFQRFSSFGVVTPSVDATSSLEQGMERPIFVSREIQTKLIIQDGDYVVIGGLLRNSKKKTVKKVPFFGDIPLIGLLFRSESTTVDQTNLVIIVQANIITSSGQRYADKKDLLEGERIVPTAETSSLEGWVNELPPIRDKSREEPGSRTVPLITR